MCKFNFFLFLNVFIPVRYLFEDLKKEALLELKFFHSIGHLSLGFGACGLGFEKNPSTGGLGFGSGVWGLKWGLDVRFGVWHGV